MKPEQLQKKITRFLQKTGMSQRELARKAGVSEKTIRNVISSNFDELSDFSSRKLIVALEPYRKDVDYHAARFVMASRKQYLKNFHIREIGRRMIKMAQDTGLDVTPQNSAG